MKKEKLKFSKVSEYIAAGGLTSGYYCLAAKPVAETDKAVAFSAKNYNSFGNQYECKVWFAKSQMQKVTNDFYKHGELEMWIVPVWLYRAKSDEGFEF